MRKFKYKVGDLVKVIEPDLCSDYTIGVVIGTNHETEFKPYTVVFTDEGITYWEQKHLEYYDGTDLEKAIYGL